MTDVPLDLGEVEVGSSTPPPTSTPVVPTHSLPKGLPAMRMIPTPTTTKDSELPPPEPDSMPFPPVDNPLPEGEEEYIALEEELARQAGRVYLRWDGGTIGIRYARAWPRSPGSLRISTSGLCPSSAWHLLTRSNFGGTRGYEYMIYESSRMRAAKRLREIMNGIRNKGVPHGWIRQDFWDRLVEFWRQEDFKKLKQALELGRTPTQSEVFARTHTGKEDREWVDKRSSDINVSLKLDYNSVIHFTFTVSQDVRSPPPLPIDEAAVWARVAGGCKRGRLYGMGVVPSHKYPQLFSDPGDDDTASGPPDLREQEVCDLKRAYSDMYSFLTQMRSGGSCAMPDMPPPPPPPSPAPSQTPPPQHDQSTGSPHHDDDTDYV
ncbi:hypothetical protein PIB30_026893 [Stylosanthes scabra]|uniref:Uncharacterized protein n=1 Tax=Stylosanthes scabra TaxID=79078 RepID=A0ABU6V8V2_9FABA|nr:hypothetical protein [Stylosanthes scabra]